MLVHLNLLCYYDCHTSLTDSAVAAQGCRPWGYPWHPQILADQLALFQPGGSKLCPPNNTGTPRIFRPSYGSAVELEWYHGSVYRDQSKRQIRSVCDCVVEKKAHSFTPHKLYADCLRWLQRLAITLKYCCCCCRRRRVAHTILNGIGFASCP